MATGYFVSMTPRPQYDGTKLAVVLLRSGVHTGANVEAIALYGDSTVLSNISLNFKNQFRSIN